MSKQTIIWKGFLRTLPFQGGVIPFGILYATIATSVGFPWWLVQLFSVIVYGGSSQLVFIDLYSHAGSVFQAVLGSNIVNARHFIYSAGVSRQFSDFPKKWRIILSYWLTDQLYAISISRREEINAILPGLRQWYFLGSAIGTWFFWFGSSFVGIFFGQLIPPSWNLSFAIPLMFMPLVISVCKSKFAIVTVVLSALFVIIFHQLPLGLGVVAAILLSSFFGYLIQKFWEKE